MNKPPTSRLLHIEDDEIDRLAVSRLIENGNLDFECDWAKDLSTARAMIGANRYQLVLADYRLPDGISETLLTEFPDLPMIFITGRGDENTAVNLLKNGAYDYLVKDFKHDYLQALPARIEIVLQRHRQKLAAAESEKRFETMANAAPVLIWISDPSNFRVYFNRPWLKFVGCQSNAADQKSENWETFLHPDDAVSYRKASASAIIGRQPYEAKFRLHHA